MMNHKQTTTASALLLLGLCPVLASASNFLRRNRQAPTICGFETKYSSTFVILEIDNDAKSNNGNGNGNGNNKNNNNKNVLSITDASDVNASFVDSYKSKCTASGLDQSLLNATLVEDAIYDETLDQQIELEALNDPGLTPIVEAATERQGELTPTGDFRVLVEVVQACNACDETPELFSESGEEATFDLGDQVPFRLSFLSGSSNPFRQFVGAVTGSGDSSSSASSASTTESKKVCSCSGPTEDDFTKAISKEFDDITVTAATQVSVLSNDLCNGFTKLQDGTIIERPSVGPTKYSYSGVCLGTDFEAYVAPTNPPSSAPTAGPTTSPTNSPTDSPTDAPTDSPTDNPTDEPTEAPVQAPVSPPEPVEPVDPEPDAAASAGAGGQAQSRTAALTAGSELP